MPGCKHGKEILVVVGCITLFWLVLVHFESLRILMQPKVLNICFSQLCNSYYTAYRSRNKFFFQLTSYINLLDVFSPLLQVSNNRTGIIIYFVLKSSMYDVYIRLCNYQFYFLILPARLLHSAQLFSFELKRNTIRILCQ